VRLSGFFLFAGRAFLKRKAAKNWVKKNEAKARKARWDKGLRLGELGEK
jgi:hypothetical protein